MLDFFFYVAVAVLAAFPEQIVWVFAQRDGGGSVASVIYKIDLYPLIFDWARLLAYICTADFLEGSGALHCVSKWWHTETEVAVAGEDLCKVRSTGRWIFSGEL